MTHIHNEAARAQDRAERRGMDTTNEAHGARRRRFLAGAATVAAGALFASSAAWACTLRDGDLSVFNSALYASCNAAGTDCSHSIGTGGQVGLAEFNQAGESMTIEGKNFPAVSFTTTWRHPGSLANCHRTSSGSDPQVLRLDAAETGPSFKIVTTSPNTSGRSVATGLARICVQEQETDDLVTLVSGQIVDVSVTL